MNEPRSEKQRKRVRQLGVERRKEAGMPGISLNLGRSWSKGPPHPPLWPVYARRRNKARESAVRQFRFFSSFRFVGLFFPRRKM